MADFNNDTKRGDFFTKNINEACYTINNNQSNVKMSVLNLTQESFTCKKQIIIDGNLNEQIKERVDLKNQNEEKEKKDNTKESLLKHYYLCNDEQKEKLLACELPELPSRLREKYEYIISEAKYNEQKDINCLGQEIIKLFNNGDITARDAYQIQMQLIKDGMAHFPWFDKEFKILWSSCGETDSEVSGKIFILFENISDHVKYCALSEIQPGDVFIFNGDFTSRVNVFTSSKIPFYEKVFIKLMKDTYDITEKEVEKNKK